MYERLPRQGRMVALPRPFVYTVTPKDRTEEQCAVIFYDNAGEHFQPGVNVIEQPGAQHVASAAGIMFLFDPFKRHVITSGGSLKASTPGTPSADAAPLKAAPKRSNRSTSAAKTAESGSAQRVL